MDEKEAKQNLDIRIMKQNATTKSAALAKEGSFKTAMDYGDLAMDYMQSAASSSEQKQDLLHYENLYGGMKEQLLSETMDDLDGGIDDELENELNDLTTTLEKEREESKKTEEVANVSMKKAKAKPMSDKTAQLLYQISAPKKK